MRRLLEWRRLLRLLLLGWSNGRSVSHVSSTAATRSSPSSSAHTRTLAMSVGKPEPRTVGAHHRRAGRYHAHACSHLRHERHLIRHNLLEHHRVDTAHHRIHHHLLLLLLLLVMMPVHAHSSTATAHHPTTVPATVPATARDRVDLSLYVVESTTTESTRWLDTVK